MMCYTTWNWDREGGGGRRIGVGWTWSKGWSCFGIGGDGGIISRLPLPETENISDPTITNTPPSPTPNPGSITHHLWTPQTYISTTHARPSLPVNQIPNPAAPTSYGLGLYALVAVNQWKKQSNAQKLVSSSPCVWLCLLLNDTSE